MAVVITRTRVCDVTGDDDAKKTYISVERDGEVVKWKIDLAKTGVDILEEQLAPVISKATLVTADSRDDDDPDPDSDEEEGAGVIEKWTPAQPAQLPVGDAPERWTFDERAAQRAYGKKHWRRLGLKKPLGDRGQVPAAVVDAWDAAGRPMFD